MVCWKVHPVVNFSGSNVLLADRVVPTPGPWVVWDPEPYINVHGHSAGAGLIREGPSLQLMVQLVLSICCVYTGPNIHVCSMNRLDVLDMICSAALYLFAIVF